MLTLSTCFTGVYYTASCKVATDHRLPRRSPSITKALAQGRLATYPGTLQGSSQVSWAPALGKDSGNSTEISFLESQKGSRVGRAWQAAVHQLILPSSSLPATRGVVSPEGPGRIHSSWGCHTGTGHLTMLLSTGWWSTQRPEQTVDKTSLPYSALTRSLGGSFALSTDSARSPCAQASPEGRQVGKAAID